MIVEDQRDIAANIWDFLERRGYVVDHAADGATGLESALHGGFDVILLDLGLPRLDGLDLCHRLRAAGHEVPVLMLTARDTLDDKLRGFTEGADDYLVKPFAMSELEARIQALHRRGRALAGETLRIGDLAYNARSMLATRGGHSIALTKAQGRILMALMHDCPAVVRHESLMRAIWDDSGGDLPALHTHMYALRGLIDRPFAHAMIQSVHGVGYRLVAGP